VSKVKPSLENASAPLPRPKRRKGAIPLLLLFVALLAIGWFTNAGGLWAKALANRALQKHDPIGALDWTTWAAWFSAEDSEANVLGIRAMVQLNMNNLAQQLLDQSMQQNSSLDLSPLKLIIAAQRGDLQASERLMNWSGPAPLPLEAYEAIIRCSQFNNLLERSELVLKELEQNGAVPQIVDYQRGRNAELTENFAKAAEEYVKAFTKYPNSTRAAFRAGVCYYKLRDFTKAEAMFRSADKEPYSAIAKVEIANCLWEQNKLPEAVQNIQFTVGFPPEHLQRLYLQVDEYVDIDRSALVAARIADGQGQNERGLEMANRVLAHNPREFEARGLQVKFLKLLNRTAEAEEAAKIQSQMIANRQRANQLRIELADHPRDLDRLCELAELYWTTESAAEAQLVLRDALQIDPKCTRALELLAKMNATSNEHPK
jgi:tetratricopeptide (TPR) repeat protein